MSTLTPAAFRARYPSFDESTYSDPVVQACLDDVITEMSESIWGGLFERGGYALAAHLLTVRSSSSPALAGVKSRTIGDVSVTFVDGSAAASELGSTSYGCEYIRLGFLVGGGGVIV